MSKSNDWTPSKRQRKLLRGMAEGKTGTQAAIEAGYAPASAAVVASNNRAKPEFRAALQKMMDDAGLSREEVIAKIREGADAQKKTYLNVNGEIVEKSDPDHSVRHRFIETARKVRGDMGEEEGAVPGGISMVAMVNIIREEAAKRGLPV